MIKLTTAQQNELTAWARERLQYTIDTGKWDGDMWFMLDETIPELTHDIDINLYEDDDGTKHAAAYGVTYTDGVPNTDCSTWVELF